MESKKPTTNSTPEKSEKSWENPNFSSSSKPLTNADKQNFAATGTFAKSDSASGSPNGTKPNPPKAGGLGSKPAQAAQKAANRRGKRGGKRGPHKNAGGGRKSDMAVLASVMDMAAQLRGAEDALKDKKTEEVEKAEDENVPEPIPQEPQGPVALSDKALLNFSVDVPNDSPLFYEKHFSSILGGGLTCLGYGGLAYSALVAASAVTAGTAVAPILGTACVIGGLAYGVKALGGMIMSRQQTQILRRNEDVISEVVGSVFDGRQPLFHRRWVEVQTLDAEFPVEADTRTIDCKNEELRYADPAYSIVRFRRHRPSTTAEAVSSFRASLRVRPVQSSRQEPVQDVLAAYDQHDGMVSRELIAEIMKPHNLRPEMSIDEFRQMSTRVAQFCRHLGLERDMAQHGEDIVGNSWLYAYLLYLHQEAARRPILGKAGRLQPQ